MQPRNPTPTTMQDDPGAAALPGRFRLMRYYALATLGLFLAAGIALVILQRDEEVFFEQAQREQQALFMKAQAELARQNEAAARASLLAVHEASHVNLTRVAANLLWATDFAPFVAAAQALPVEACRALPPDETAAAARKDCQVRLGARLMALPGFATLDAKAHAAMQSTTVFKIKIWDLRGIAVYSSEHAQIGEDGAAKNEGWRIAALEGRPASEQTHRDRFSAFEGVVENRDLISTYVPVRDAGTGQLAGVVELYSDVTPFLAQIRDASARFAAISAEHEAQVERAAQAQRASVHTSSDRFLVIVGGLLVLLYAASLVVVRIGQRIIDRQALAQAEAGRREQLWHREKMASLAAMAANVSHEVGNPLAVIAGAAQQLPDAPGEPDAPRRLILAQAGRIGEMMRRISDFADARSDAPEWVDVNAMVKAVCAFLGFDRRFRGMPIDFEGAPALPARELVPDHLNEVMMNLLQACAEAGPARPARLQVATAERGDEVIVRIGCVPADAEPGQATAIRPDAPGLLAARRRLQAMGAQLSIEAHAVEVSLPPPAVPAA